MIFHSGTFFLFFSEILSTISDLTVALGIRKVEARKGIAKNCLPKFLGEVQVNFWGVNNFYFDEKCWGTPKQPMKLQQPRNYDFGVFQFNLLGSQGGNSREVTTSPPGHY